jgi:hypothetical protein
LPSVSEMFCNVGEDLVDKKTLELILMNIF